MSAEARANGWRGFDGLAEKVDRIMGEKGSKAGWLYRCDGMPTLAGCGSTVVVPRRWSRVGVKTSGWLVCYGLDCIDDSKPMDDPSNLVEDRDVVLTFCPSCRAVVEGQ